MWMTSLKEIYKCNKCGNVVEMVSEGAGALVCCGSPMEKLIAKTVDAGSEKHVPIVEAISSGVKVTVGSVAHPMEEKHYIKFIEVITFAHILRAELLPGMEPCASFKIARSQIREVRTYCNVHNLWKS
ncbi:desulfoferrodoxin [Candidatus Omnitrophus magneticus]|uniref:Desulfoferrodoxin n=1 Tax=Candidatus Omnitrophus magneticus TaxID=1609969 RepID=A0A0F0CV53_9BACT|nr:desulfoferrodoxin [Candidatus Omnitrophus magneticus]